MQTSPNSKSQPQVNQGDMAISSGLHNAFEAWTASLQDRYHLARRSDNPLRYATDRTWHAFLGYAGSHTVELSLGETRCNARQCFEGWACRGPVNLQRAKYRNYSTYASRATQYLYEGFLGGLHERVAAYFAKASSFESVPAPTESAPMSLEVQNACLRKLLALEQERSRVLKAELTEWQRLRNVDVLHASLARGLPALLPTALFVHLANRQNDATLLDYDSYRLGQEQAPLGTTLGIF